MRPNDDTYFSLIARATSLRSTCPRRSVGAVLVGLDRRIISTGYNGSPSGFIHCFGEGCKHETSGCINTIHAEANAIARAKEIGWYLYCTDTPCINCLKLALAHNNQIEIIWQREYIDPVREHFLDLHPKVREQLRQIKVEEENDIEELLRSVREF